MMDATPLYQYPPHPANETMRRDWKGPAHAFTRTERPVKYYFIDFGLSRRYSAHERPPSEAIIQGGSKDVPEHQGEATHCDPFPTDVWYLGDLIKTYLIDVWFNLTVRSPTVH